ncbi:MAG: potassium channel family protein [Lentimicrobium sp.]
MLLPVSISLAIIVLTIIIHGWGTSWWIKYLFRKHISGKQNIGEINNGLYILSSTAIFLMILHFTEITIWAVAYLLITDIPQLSNYEQAIYFSMITYTTVGYGDITLIPRWRIMCGFEAMSGILLFGWSTAMFFSAVQRLLGKKILTDFQSGEKQ